MNIADWIEKHMIPCIFKETCGFDCPGCGMQRAIIELLRGDIITSLKHYPALFPLFFLLMYLVLHLIFKFRHGAKVLKITFFLTTAIILIHYIYKLIIHFKLVS